jgi:FkbM family methyltransferase
MDAFLVNKRIDLVDFDGLKLFMLEDDDLYRTAVPEARKHQDVDTYQQSLAAQGPPPGPVTPANVRQVASTRHGISVVIHHLWEHGVDFVVLDIGSHIGDFGLKIANLIRTFNRRTKVISFDPSEPGALVPYSIELNRLGHVIKHEMLAVSDGDGLSLFRYRPGFTSGGEIATATQGAAALAATWLRRFRQLPLRRRISAYLALAFAGLKRMMRLGKVVDSYSLIVRSVDILGYLERNRFEGDVFAKIDIEGHDPRVVNRLLRLIAQRKLFLVFEFTPIRYASHETAVDYLEKLNQHFHFFDLYYCPNPTRFQQISPKDLSSFVAEVRLRSQGYTDVFLLDKRTPACEELIKRLAALLPEADTTIL